MDGENPHSQGGCKKGNYKEASWWSSRPADVKMCPSMDIEYEAVTKKTRQAVRLVTANALKITMQDATSNASKKRSE